MSAARKKLQELRQLMSKNGLDAYYVPGTDPHQSEYVPACWKRREWLSGFTGSAGDMLVTSEMAGLWTDGRYFLQAAEELKGSTIKLFKMGLPGVPSLTEWVERQMKPGQVLGADPRLLSRKVASDLEAALRGAKVKLKLVEQNLVDRIWTDRPPPAPALIESIPGDRAGETVASKLRRLRKAMAERKAQAHVLTALDAIAWLFNIRGADVDYNPVAIAYAVVTADQALLFVDPAKVSADARRALKQAVETRPYQDIGAELGRLASARERVWVDGQTANVWVTAKLKGCELVTDPSPIGAMKARKNDAEIAGIKAAQLRDGVAMVRFLSWLEREVPGGGVSELSAAEKLAELRREGDLFRGESFATIAGYGAHGAIIHYQPTDQTNVALRPEGLFLIDSGGQYLDGTTDITRTIALGEPTAEQRDRFTRVLQGHIAIARLRFPLGVAGRRIDALARLPLWRAGLDYNHGTGHGVGAFLSVHEGPQFISHTRCIGVPLEEGNIQSNEPGFYKDGEYGIRIENLVLVKRDSELGGDAGWLCFETLTLCPIDTRLIEPGMLGREEREWLNDYHERVRQALRGALSREETDWLDRATRPL